MPAKCEYLTGPYQERFFETMRGHGGGPGGESTTAPASMPAGAPGMPPQMPAETAPAAMPPRMPPAEGAPPGMPPVAQPAGMGSPPSIERMYLAQLLWDEAMSNAVVKVRDGSPSSRVMLIVGGFHVESDGGTAQKIAHQRPHDRIFTVAFHGTTEGRFTFDPDDRGAGDVVIYGIQPPPEEKRPTMPPAQPGAASTAPATTAPAGP